MPLGLLLNPFVVLGEPVPGGEEDGAAVSFYRAVPVQRGLTARVRAADGEHEGKHDGGSDECEWKLGSEPEAKAEIG